MEEAFYDFDVTKLSVYTRDIGLAGIEVYDLLRDEYDIQIELGDIANILAYISIGDRIQDIERLVGALADIKRLYSKDPASMLNTEYINPRYLYHRRQHFIQKRHAFQLERHLAAFVPNLSCVIRRESQFWHQASLLQTKLLNMYFMQRKRAVLAGNGRSAVEYLNVL